MEPAFAEYQRQIVGTRGGSPRGSRRRVPLVSRRHRQPPDARRRVLLRKLTGKVAEAALGKAGITVNKNSARRR
jgi:glycine/serine hydroxymethyltransferase